jgi:hypothetical protein
MESPSLLHISQNRSLFLVFLQSFADLIIVSTEMLKKAVVELQVRDFVLKNAPYSAPLVLVSQIDSPFIIWKSLLTLLPVVWILLIGDYGLEAAVLPFPRGPARSLVVYSFVFGQKCNDHVQASVFLECRTCLEVSAAPWDIGGKNDGQRLNQLCGYGWLLLVSIFFYNYFYVFRLKTL